MKIKYVWYVRFWQYWFIPSNNLNLSSILAKIEISSFDFGEVFGLQFWYINTMQFIVYRMDCITCNIHTLNQKLIIKKINTYTHISQLRNNITYLKEIIHLTFHSSPYNYKISCSIPFLFFTPFPSHTLTHLMEQSLAVFTTICGIAAAFR